MGEVGNWKGLSEAQVAFFMKHGYVKLEGVFSREAAAEKTKNLWVRLGMDPEDKSTWTKEWINMPGMP